MPSSVCCHPCWIQHSFLKASTTLDHISHLASGRTVGCGLRPCGPALRGPGRSCSVCGGGRGVDSVQFVERGADSVQFVEVGEELTVFSLWRWERS